MMKTTHFFAYELFDKLVLYSYFLFQMMLNAHAIISLNVFRMLLYFKFPMSNVNTLYNDIICSFHSYKNIVFVG